MFVFHKGLFMLAQGFWTFTWIAGDPGVGAQIDQTSQRKKETDHTRWSVLFLAGVQGFEPRKCQSQSLMPYRLATPQYFQQTILYHIKLSLSIPILNFFEKIIHYFLFFRKIAFFYFTNALFCDTIQRSIKNLPVAQLDSASDSDSEGQRFESVRVGQNNKREDNFLPYFSFG